MTYVGMGALVGTDKPYIFCEMMLFTTTIPFLITQVHLWIMTVQTGLILLSAWMVFHAVPSSSWIYSKNIGPIPGGGICTFLRRRPMVHEDGSSVCLSEQKRAVGDVVQGLHGGKYQFDDSSHGGSFEGRQFAETGYGSSSVDESIIASEQFANEPLPNWARKLVELPLPENSPELLLMLEESKGGGPLPNHGIEIQIQNEERSWEMYYAFVVGPLSESVGMIVEPRVGQLAPRGGVGPFSDTAIVRLQCQDEGPPPSSSPTTTSGMTDVSASPSWLVVGTEAARWFYRLRTTRYL